MTKTSRPFGLWPSPISPDLVGSQLRLDDVQWDSDGRTIAWSEGGAQTSLYARRAGDARRCLSGDIPLKGGIGYGGGEFTIVQGTTFFTSRGGVIYRRDLGQSSAHAITPAFGGCASPTLSPDGRWLLYVYSDGHTDLLGLVDASGKEWPIQLVKGATFYMQPAWRPGSENIAWVEWDHPNMPWDGTRIKIGHLSGTPPRMAVERIVAGGPQTPASQPLFSPDGRWLSFIECNGEWERLVLLDVESGEKRTLVDGNAFMLAPAAWSQGLHSYGWSASSQRIFYTRESEGKVSLWVVDLASGQSQMIDTSPYTWLSQLSVSPLNDDLAMLASSPTIPTRVIRRSGSHWNIEVSSDPEEIPADYYSIPRDITWPAQDGRLVHGLFYPPVNPQYTFTGLPPTIINVHGGPTGSRGFRFNEDAAYFTTRGYAYMELNYRGSTGFGRSYMNALRENWGPVDCEDAAGAVRAISDQKLGDNDRMVVCGGSAGGFTVLNCLVHYPGLFRAGVCLYGVANLYTLAVETHKFEERYTESLVGPLASTSDRYFNWSPLFHAEKIRDPLAVFQGSVDPVVVPSHSESIVQALKRNNVPHIYRVYEGEGHGFRRKESIADYLRTTESFLQQYVLFAPPKKIVF
jgi:dipeptidyl aminopeptidase/acylaminoacyl peptidase